MTWKIELERLLSGALYNRDYRYADIPKNMLNFYYDLMPEGALEADVDSCALEDPDAQSEPLKPESKLFSHICGNICQRSGVLHFTSLKPAMHAALMNRLAEHGMLPAIALKPHDGNMKLAMKAADKHGYDRFAVQRHLRGAFRGFYLGGTICGDIYQERLLICTLLPEERLWRLRELRVEHVRMQGESDHALKSRATKSTPGQKSMREGFAAFGTNAGVAFNFDNNEKGEIAYSFGDYAFIRKGRRVSAMVADVEDHHQAAFPLSLALKPAVINRALDIMRFWDD